MLDLKAKPFYLNEEDIAWVQETLASMTLEQKAGQVFCPMGFSADPTVLRHLICDIGVGGMMYRPGLATEMRPLSCGRSGWATISTRCRREQHHPLQAGSGGVCQSVGDARYSRRSLPCG